MTASGLHDGVRDWTLTTVRSMSSSWLRGAFPEQFLTQCLNVVGAGEHWAGQAGGERTVNLFLNFHQWSSCERYANALRSVIAWYLSCFTLPIAVRFDLLPITDGLPSSTDVRSTAMKWESIKRIR